MLDMGEPDSHRLLSSGLQHPSSKLCSISRPSLNILPTFIKDFIAKHQMEPKQSRIREWGAVIGCRYFFCLHF